MSKREQIAVMPFTGHTPSDLKTALSLIATCNLPIEAFDAFLHQYAQTQDLTQSWHFARCEWDL